MSSATRKSLSPSSIVSSWSREWRSVQLNKLVCAESPRRWTLRSSVPSPFTQIGIWSYENPARPDDGLPDTLFTGLLAMSPSRLFAITLIVTMKAAPGRINGALPPRVRCRHRDQSPRSPFARGSPRESEQSVDIREENQR